MVQMLFLVLCLFWVSLADAGTIARPTKSFGGTTYINGVVPQASDFNGDFSTIYNEFNGAISNVNISASAAIAATKINPSGFNINVRTATTLPCKILDETDQAADARRWALCVSGGVLQLNTLTDADVTQNTWLTVNRGNGSFVMGGLTGANEIRGTTNFTGAVTFASGNDLAAPSGSVMMYMGATAPTGWLLLDGSTVSCTGAAGANALLCSRLVGLYGTANYKGAASFTITVDIASNEIIHGAHGKAVGDRVHFTSTTTLPAPLSATGVYCIISTTTDRFVISTVCGGSAVDITDAGTGTHSDYFNFVVPDARGRSIVGTGSGSGLTARTLGATGGAEDAVLVSHTHTATVTDPGHVHTFNRDTSGGGGVGGDTGNSVNGTRTTNSNTTGITVSNSTVGVSATGANMDPFIVMTYIIRL